MLSEEFEESWVIGMSTHSEKSCGQAHEKICKDAKRAGRAETTYTHQLRTSGKLEPPPKRQQPASSQTQRNHTYYRELLVVQNN